METNPWNEIKLCDYENHMSNQNVLQLQVLNTIMKEQIEEVCIDNEHKYTVTILGITNGNGLEHINSLITRKVIGIDINKEYLCECKNNYKHLNDILNLQQIDLMTNINKVQKLIKNSDLIIADLIIEHIHLNNFVKIIRSLSKQKITVSCVIQYNPDGTFVSNSGYEQVFDCLMPIIEEESEENITNSLIEIGYELVSRKIYDLPNGKSLIRLDYCNM